MFVASLSFSSCEILGIRSCPAIPVWAIHVDVVDAVTGLPVDDALVIARDGVYADSVRTGQFAGAPARLALGRAGTYTVEVEHPHYAPAVRSGIRVTRGECAVNTVTIRVDLTAATSTSASVPGLQTIPTAHPWTPEAGDDLRVYVR